MSTGILSFGAYLPRARLQRKVIAEAHGWFDASLKNLGRGERTMAAWDEDTITLSVEASRACVENISTDDINNVFLASTSLPFLDRQNAGLVAEALNLKTNLQVLDITGSQKSGTSALLSGLKVAALGEQSLVIASERRRTKAASKAEMLYGDGAASLLIGEGDVIAELLASHSESVDFVDHFRTEESAFDYHWEERWIRDEGLLNIVHNAVNTALDKAGIKAEDIDHFCCALGSDREQKSLAKKLGLNQQALQDTLQTHCGHTGSAHALLQLIGALENAKPGERIMVVGFGQGSDVLLFKATDALTKQAQRTGLKACLENRLVENNYFKYLTINGLLEMDLGIRAETDKNTPLTTAYRNKDLTTGFIGGKCKQCGTLQIPKTNICVNSECHSIDSQEPYPFANATGKLNSYTADRLTYSIDPPACYGMVQFNQGGRIMIDFADVIPEQGLHVDMPMRMVFRVKDYDRKRGFRRYYWKAAPVYSASSASGE